MDDLTTRSLILGALASLDRDEPVRLRNRVIPTPAKTQETHAIDTNPLSAKDVASQILTRSASRRKRKPVAVATPSAEATPRTLIGGFLGVSSISKSAVAGLHSRKSKLTKSPDPVAPSAKKRRSARQSISDNTTPRTIVQGILKEASAETPLEAPLDIHVDHVLSEEEQEDLLPTLTLKNTVKETEASPELPSSTSLPAITDGNEEVTKNADEEINFSKVQSIDAQNGTLATNPDFVEVAEEHDPCGTPDLDFEDSENTEEDTQPSQVSLGLQTEAVYVGRVREHEISKWKDLVTPELPPAKKRALTELLQKTTLNKDCGRMQKTSKKPIAARKPRSQTSSTTGGGLPSSLVKSILQHFSNARVSKAALAAVEHGSSLFFKQLSSDLMAYCRHAGRHTIELSDVELLMKRQGLITTKQSMYSLIEKYLPLEYRQEIIPVVQSGNKLVLK